MPHWDSGEHVVIDDTFFFSVVFILMSFNTCCINHFTFNLCMKNKQKNPKKFITGTYMYMVLQFSLPAIRNLAKSWRLSCKPRMRSADGIPMWRLAFVFFLWKCTQVLQKSLSLSIKHACFKRYHHDLLRHLVAFSKFEWFISSDQKLRILALI